MGQFFIYVLAIFVFIGCANEFKDDLDDQNPLTEQGSDFLLSVSLVPDTLNEKSLKWNVEHSSWSDEDEKRFQGFIATIGKSVRDKKCRTTSGCINSSVNPYFQFHPSGFKNVFSDCADLPYTLRAYFAWIFDLPFSYQSSMTKDTSYLRNAERELKRSKRNSREYSKWKKIIKKEKKNLKRDIRYFVHGNQVNRRRNIKTGDNINKVLRDIVDSVSTAMYRIDASRFDRNLYEKDLYPVSIDLETLVPGTVVYAANGHVGIVTEVTPQGKVYLMDAHPDNSITYISYSTDKFPRSPIKRGAGFARFRPLELNGSQASPLSNDQVFGFSLDQYLGVPNQLGASWKEVDFEHNGLSLSFPDYLKEKLKTQTIEPLEDFKLQVKDLCTDVQARVDSVNQASLAGLPSKKHPRRLPDNIYGAQGEWETYSTPSRDGRLKLSIKSIIEFIERHDNGEFKTAYQEITDSCLLNIKNGQGRDLSLRLNDVVEKVYQMSFDPYHCVEWRWGVIKETKNCSLRSNKFDWYQAQQGLRQIIAPDYSLFTGYTLRELENQTFKSSGESLSIREAFR